MIMTYFITPKGNLILSWRCVCCSENIFQKGTLNINMLMPAHKQTPWSRSMQCVALIHISKNLSIANQDSQNNSSSFSGSAART